jgi:plasmid replication initiation protein
MTMTPRRFYNPQFDLFLPNIVDLRFRDQKDTMERPFFSLSKSKRMKSIEYRNENDGIFVTVQPHQDYGMATIWDADVLIWAASVLSDMKNRRLNEIPRELKFQPHDLLKVIGRATGGKDYLQLRGALDRLKSTIINTNIRAARGTKHITFSWIDQWEDLVDSRTKESRGLTLTLSDWFYRGVTEEGACFPSTPPISRSAGVASAGSTVSPASTPGATARKGSPSPCRPCSRNPGPREPTGASSSKCSASSPAMTSLASC